MAHDIAAEVGCQVLVTGHPDLRRRRVAGVADGDPSTLPPLRRRRRPGRSARALDLLLVGNDGAPKGACHTDASIMNGPNGMITRLDMGPKDRYPMVFPITHIGGIGVMVFALETGCPLILMETFNMVDSPMWLAEQGATFLGSTVPFFHAYLDAQRRYGSEPLYPGLRALLGGGPPSRPISTSSPGGAVGAAGSSRRGDSPSFPSPPTAVARRQRRGPVVDRGQGRARAWSSGWSAPRGSMPPGGGGRAAGPRARSRSSGYVDGRLDADAVRRPGLLPDRRPRRGRPPRATSASPAG